MNRRSVGRPTTWNTTDLLKPTKLKLHVVGERAYCGRPGCDRLIGTVVLGGGYAGHIRLPHTAREKWVQVQSVNPETHEILPSEWQRKRQRHPYRMFNWVTTALAFPGDVVVCTNPACRARQMVPPSH